MPRRIHVPQLEVGEILLEPSEVHHARDVLRLGNGQVVEVFDDAGRTASATIVLRAGNEVAVRVEQFQQLMAGVQWTVAAAVPKGERADWMVEKLSELGTAKFIPLATERSVVLPEGKNKHERWARIAVESAKQSRRPGVMEIATLTRVADVISMFRSSIQTTDGWYFSTSSGALPIAHALHGRTRQSLLFLIGPEGGWTPNEMESFDAAGLAAVSLTQTTLRVETAAIAAAAVVASMNPKVAGET